MKKIARMTDDELRAFVTAVLRNEVFCSAQVPLDQQPSILPMVFMPLAFGGLSSFTRDELEDVGLLWEHFVDPESGRPNTFPRAFNGYPTFGSVRLMHKEDWTRARAAIERAEAQLGNVTI